jgi:uncharacterized membrane protein YGL010W
MSQQPPPFSRRPLLWLLHNWRLRHQNPFNFWIHMIGIPLAVVGVVLLFFVPWYWGLIAFVLGYLLQWIGHKVEGNDVGELIPLKKMLGLPYVDIARPRKDQEAS